MLESCVTSNSVESMIRDWDMFKTVAASTDKINLPLQISSVISQKHRVLIRQMLVTYCCYFSSHRSRRLQNVQVTNICLGSFGLSSVLVTEDSTWDSCYEIWGNCGNSYRETLIEL